MTLPPKSTFIFASSWILLLLLSLVSHVSHAGESNKLKYKIRDLFVPECNNNSPVAVVDALRALPFLKFALRVARNSDCKSLLYLAPGGGDASSADGLNLVSFRQLFKMNIFGIPPEHVFLCQISPAFPTNSVFAAQQFD